MESADLRRRIEESLDRVVCWVRDHRYRGYEPADGNSSILFPLTGGRVLPMRLLQQAVLRAPFNVRPLLGIAPHESAIGRGYMAWGYTLMCRGAGAEALRREAAACFEWLVANRAGGYQGFSWGDPYEYATRSGRRPRGEPLLVWSALIGLAFLDAYEQFGSPEYLDVAKGVGEWVMRLPSELTDEGRCLSYVAYCQSSIHNSNALGAAFLARLSQVTGDGGMRRAAHDAVAYTCSKQRQDGSWWYAEAPKYRWIDSFHTGYILSALYLYSSASGDSSFDAQLSKGTDYYISHFFDEAGRPVYFHDGRGPIDIQCAAQAIDTLVTMSGRRSSCLALARRVARWTIDNMQARDGHFCYRHLGWLRVSTPMLHWGQATMVKALAAALEASPHD